MVDEVEDYVFDAETLARAWLAVASAASEDSERPVLYRSVAIEIWEDGVRLTSTDSYMIWSAWVPRSGRANRDAPTFAELPDVVFTASDTDFRGRDLLKYAFKTVTAKDAPPQTLRVTFGPAPLAPGQFPGTQSDAVSLSFPADVAVNERVVLATIEGRYPEWRPFFVAKPKATVSVGINPELAARLVSIKRFYPEPFKLTFTGASKAVLVDPQGDQLKPDLIGAFMPVTITELVK